MKILTVISNYNEEGAISDTIDDIIHNSSIETDILVIDNGSSDKSLEIIKSKHINYLFHPVNTGGSAGVIKTAFAYAHYHNYDVYCHMDGDNQHMASALKKIVNPIILNESDIIIGSRFIQKEGFQSHLFRRIGIRLFSFLLSKITSEKLTDITSGFRAYNNKAIRFFAVNYKHEIEASVQLLLVSHFAGLRVNEVAVTMRPRDTGKSEFNLINAFKFPIYAIISLVGTVLQKNK